MSGNSKAAVESMIRFVGKSNAGKRNGREPVARMQCSKSKRSTSPGLSIRSSRSRVELSKVPRAWITSTLRRLANCFKPPVSVSITFSLRARSASTSICGGANLSPQPPSSLVSLTTLATCSNALEGMQPRSRHTPPSRGSASTIVTFMPKSAAKNAAA